MLFGTFDGMNTTLAATLSCPNTSTQFLFLLDDRRPNTSFVLPYRWTLTTDEATPYGLKRPEKRQAPGVESRSLPNVNQSQVKEVDMKEITPSANGRQA